MRKHTSVLCVETHLEGKMYSQNTRRVMKKRMENKKKLKAVIHYPCQKAKNDNIICSHTKTQV